MNGSKLIIWMVHPRDMSDIERGMPALKMFPAFLKILALLCLSPYKASAFNENGKTRGYVVAVPLLPVHFQRYKRFAAFRLSQAFKLAKKLGAGKVSVGGMITTLAEKTGMSKRYDLEIYDGTDLLAQIAAEKVAQLIKDNSNIETVGIIGATTKTGSMLSKYLTGAGMKELHLFAKTAVNVRKLAEECRKMSKAKIIDHTNLESVKGCDVCVLTAFIPEAGKELVRDLKRGSQFMSVIEPVSPFVFDIEKNRPDIKLTKGVKIKAPSLSYTGLDFVIPSGNAFSCLAEALMTDGEGKPRKLDRLDESLKEHNLQIA